MIADPNRVVVTSGSAVHVVQIRHQDIPELSADGESPESAAANLARDLAREIEGAPDDLLREAFQRALADVRAFMEASMLSRAEEEAIMAGIGNYKMTDALRRTQRAPGGDRGACPGGSMRPAPSRPEGPRSTGRPAVPWSRVGIG